MTTEKPTSESLTLVCGGVLIIFIGLTLLFGWGWSLLSLGILLFVLGLM